MHVRPEVEAWKRRCRSVRGLLMVVFVRALTFADSGGNVGVSDGEPRVAMLLPGELMVRKKG